MLRLVVLTVALAACASAQQNVDPKLAKILKEQRFNAGDGRTGAAFATEDGHVFREESDNEGNRVGQYSYIGEDGKTYTVKYSAGKDGFRILEGSHISASGREAAPFVASAEEEEEPEEVAPARPSAAVPVAAPAVPVAAVNTINDFDDEEPAGNPFINPHDPTHRDFQHNKNAAAFDPASPASRQQSLVPPCADCEGINPFVNPFDSSHQNAGILAGHLAGLGVPAAPAPVARASPAVRTVPLASSPLATPLQGQTTTTPVPVPTNFFPPGQLKLNRFETGFNFDFQS